MAYFEKMRVSLSREEPGGLLQSGEHKESFRGRRDFLAAAFSQPRDFLTKYGDNRISFTPLEMPEKYGDYVAGFFKRQRPVTLHEENLKPYQADNYESALIVLSLEKSQVAWVQSNAKVGSAKPLLESFFEFLVKRTDVNDWQVFVRYMEKEDEYWSIISERRSEIAHIQFTFIPPNALGADDSIYELIKAIQSEANPEVQQHTYKASPGQMNPETPHLEASAKIAFAGGGEAEVRDANRKILYKSGQRRITDEIDDEDMPTPEQPSFVRRVISKLFNT